MYLLKVNNGNPTKICEIFNFLFENGITENGILTVHCVKSVRIRSYSGPYSGRMRQNTDQNNSEYGQFSRSGRQRIQFDYLQRYP